jgi:hypothetical protein
LRVIAIRVGKSRFAISAKYFTTLLSPRLYKRNSPHDLSSWPDEMSPAVPVLGFINIHQPDVRRAHQRLGLKKSLARFLMGHFIGSQLAQFGIDPWQQLLSRMNVAFIDP